MIDFLVHLLLIIELSGLTIGISCMIVLLLKLIIDCIKDDIKS